MNREKNSKFHIIPLLLIVILACTACSAGGPPPALAAEPATVQELLETETETEQETEADEAGTVQNLEVTATVTPEGYGKIRKNQKNGVADIIIQSVIAFFIFIFPILAVNYYRKKR